MAVELNSQALIISLSLGAAVLAVAGVQMALRQRRAAPAQVPPNANTYPTRWGNIYVWIENADGGMRFCLMVPPGAGVVSSVVTILALDASAQTLRLKAAGPVWRSSECFPKQQGFEANLAVKSSDGRGLLMADFRHEAQSGRLESLQ